jgi:hypothetical protein
MAAIPATDTAARFCTTIAAIDVGTTPAAKTPQYTVPSTLFFVIDCNPTVMTTDRFAGTMAMLWNVGGTENGSYSAVKTR